MAETLELERMASPSATQLGAGPKPVPVAKSNYSWRGGLGQLVSKTLNNRTVPWIWSVIEFDSSGNPTYSDVAMFPTYSVYVNGSLAWTHAQSPVASFIANDQTYQRIPSDIQ